MNLILNQVHTGSFKGYCISIVFYEVALSKEDSFLVTGNIKHFPKKPFIVTPAEMLTIIDEMAAGPGRVLNDPASPYGI